jgi:hypothetical protein
MEAVNGITAEGLATVGTNGVKFMAHTAGSAGYYDFTGTWGQFINCPL